jgi:hypothetical protein
MLSRSLGGDTEESRDELRLPHRVSSVQLLDLPLPYHVHRFNVFNRPLGGVKRAEALHRPSWPADRTVVLLNYIVEVFDAPQLAIRG